MFDAYHLDCVDGSLYFSNDKPKEKCSKYGNCIFYEKTNKRSICSRNRNRNLFCVDFLKNQSINSAYLSTLPNESDDVLLRSPFIVLFILSSIPFFLLYLYAFLSIFGLSFFLVLFCSFFFVEFGRGLPRASGYPPASDFDDITQAPPLIYFLIFGLFCFVFYSFLFFFVYRR